MTDLEKQMVDALRARLLEKLADMEYSEAFEALNLDPWSVIESEVERISVKKLLELI